MMPSPFDPLEFLSLARRISDQDQQEATLRTSIGRAYYSLYLLARQHTHPGRGRVHHSEVVDRMNRMKNLRRVVNQFSEMRRLREVADYELLPNNPADRDWSRNWNAVLAMADRILPELKRP